MLFRQMGGVEAAQRTADQGDRPGAVLRQFGLDVGDGLARAVGQRRAGVVRLPADAGHVLAELFGLAGRGGGIEAVEIDDHPGILPGRGGFQRG